MSFKLGAVILPVEIDSGSAKSALKTAAAAGRTLENRMTRVGSAGKESFSAIGQSAQKAASSVRRSARQMSASLKRVTKDTKILGVSIGDAAKTGAAAIAGLGVALGVGLAKSIVIASDRQESLNQSMLVFGDLLPNIRSELALFASATNASEAELTRFATGFGLTFNAFNLGAQQARDMSVVLTKLSVDLASLRNLQGGAAEAAERLQKGLAGETENFKALGVIINETITKQELQRTGQDKLTGIALEAAKVQARYNILLRQTAIAQGDATRTSSGFANAIRGLQAQFIDLAAGSGESFLPLTEQAIASLKALVSETAPGLIELSKETAIFLSTIAGGEPGIDGLTESINGLTGAATENLKLWTATISNFRVIKQVITTELIPTIETAANQILETVEMVTGLTGLGDRLKSAISGLNPAGTLQDMISLVEVEITELAGAIGSGTASIIKYALGAQRAAQATRQARQEVGALGSDARLASQPLLTMGEIFQQMQAGTLGFGPEPIEIPVKVDESALKAAAAEAKKQFDDVAGNVRSIIESSFGELEGLGAQAIIGDPPSIAENARRVLAISSGDIGGEAAMLLKQQAPDIAAVIFREGVDPQAEAKRIVEDFTRGAGFSISALVDKAAAKDLVRQAIFRTANMNEIVEEISNELVAEGFTVGQVQAAIAETGVLGDKQGALLAASISEQGQAINGVSSELDLLSVQGNTTFTGLTGDMDDSTTAAENLNAVLSEGLAILNEMNMAANQTTAAIQGTGSSLGLGAPENVVVGPGAANGATFQIPGGAGASDTSILQMPVAPGEIVNVVNPMVQNQMNIAPMPVVIELDGQVIGQASANFIAGIANSQQIAGSTLTV
jgi:hypothetical protein